MPLIVTYVWICDDCGEAAQAGVLAGPHTETTETYFPYPGDGWSPWNERVICPACLTVAQARQREEHPDWYGPSDEEPEQ